MAEVRVVAAVPVAPLGVGAEAFWAGLAGPAPLVELPADEVPAPGQAIAFVPDFDAEAHADRRTLRKVSELARLATVAAALACVDWDPSEAEREATGVVFGTCLGSSGYHLEHAEQIHREGLDGASALLFAESVYNAAASHVAKVHGFRGPNTTLVGGEDVGLAAIAAAADAIAAERMSDALAGGADQYDRRTHASLVAHGLLEDAAIGEGAGLLRLSSRTDAPALARLAGWSSARAPVANAADALARACAEALAQAGAERPDLVIGGAPSELERAQLTALGAPPVCWLTPLTGEAFAGRSGLAAVTAALAIDRGAPPSAEGAGDELRHVLCWALSAAGSASALVLRAD